MLCVLKSAHRRKPDRVDGKSERLPMLITDVRTFLCLILCLALSGCYVALRGHASSDGSGAITSTSGPVVPRSPSGLSVAFGSPGAPDATGAHVSFGRGAAAVVVLGLMIAESMNYLGSMLWEEHRPQLDPARSVSSTCSCYGWKPDLTQEPATQ